jgi:Fe-S cluster assembly protein SufD
MPASSARPREERHEHACPKHTRSGRKALIDAFGARRLADLPGDGAVMIKRDNAIERSRLGLPTARRGLALYRPAPPADEGSGLRCRWRPRPVAPLLEGSTVLPC